MLCCREKPSGAGLWFSCCNEYPWTAVPKWPGLLHRWRSWVIQFIFSDLNELKWEHNLAWNFSLMLSIIKPRIIDAFSAMPKITQPQQIRLLSSFLCLQLLPNLPWPGFHHVLPGWPVWLHWVLLVFAASLTCKHHTLPLTLGIGRQGRRILEPQNELCWKGPLEII